jgi:hypothetical protein
MLFLLLNWLHLIELYSLLCIKKRKGSRWTMGSQKVPGIPLQIENET